MINVKNMVFLCIKAGGGILSGITNTGQQLYEELDMPYGLNPSRDTTTLQCRASAASSAWSSTNFFHALPSYGCPIVSRPFSSGYLFPSLCHVICFADAKVMCIRWILFM